MDPRFIINIRQQNYGWSCSHAAGTDRVFALKEQALQFARLQCSFIAAEIRICGRDGVEHRLRLGPDQQQDMFAEERGSSKGPAEVEPSVIEFATPKQPWTGRERTGTNGD